MEIHRFSSAYILRYRTLWDKLMGLMILIYAPDEYESFVNAKSKKLRFQKLAEKHQFAEEQFLKKLGELLNRFDTAFPSAQAHLPGAHDDYSIALQSLNPNPQIQLLGFWNAVNGFISKFGKIITKVPQSWVGCSGCGTCIEASFFYSRPCWDICPVKRNVRCLPRLQNISMLYRCGVARMLCRI
jgi:hypothetical protein